MKKRSEPSSDAGFANAHHTLSERVEDRRPQNQVEKLKGLFKDLNLGP